MVTIGQQMMFKPRPELPALGEKDYVALLKWRRGERRALREASPEVRSRVVPVIEVTTRRARERDTLLRTSLPHLAQYMAEDVGTNVPVWLDLAKIRAEHGVVVNGVNYPAVPYVYETLRLHNVFAIPVVRLGDSSTPVQALSDVVREDGYGICIRARPRTLVIPSGTTYETLVHAAISRIGVAIEQCDLLFDLEWLSEDTIIQPEEVAYLLDKFLAIGSWRNVIVAATSMPSSLGIIPEDSLGTIPRREWNLWRQLVGLHVGRSVTFGDYGIQHSEAPEEAMAVNMKANIRYTLDTSTLIARGRSLRDEGAMQYRQLCDEIFSHPDYRRPEFSWGDSQIERCAAGHLEPENGPIWRAIGTSHHLGVVTDQLNAA
jgi:hypothetical protein